MKDRFGVDPHNFLLLVQTFLEDDRYAHVTNEMHAELIASVSEKITSQYDVLARDMVSMVSVPVLTGFKIMISFMCLNTHASLLHL